MTDNLRGCLFMIASMAGFAMEDMFLKSAARVMPLGLVLLIMGLLGMLWFATRSQLAGEAVFPSGFRSPTMLVRSGFEVAGRLFYALAVALTPLTVASSILQATPLVVVLGAALIFREPVGAWRWILTILGFCGVILVLRPGLAGFDSLSLLAVLGLLGFAGRDLATRAAPSALSNTQLGTAGFAVLAFSGLVLLLHARTATTTTWAFPTVAALVNTLAATGFGLVGYSYLTRAMRTGDVSVVTPFRYTRLLFALGIGMLVFGERPDFLTLIGSAIIVTCGALVLASARRE